MKKCKYKASSPIEQYIPECCIENDPAFDEPTYTWSVGSEADDWVHCPFCGRKIKFKTGE